MARHSIAIHGRPGLGSPFGLSLGFQGLGSLFQVGWGWVKGGVSFVVSDVEVAAIGVGAVIGVDVLCLQKYHIQ